MPLLRFLPEATNINFVGARYYAFAIDKNFTLTADYQLITNPAYNADRRPVSIFSGRLHGEF